jgi:hypothetical protein
VRWQICQIAGGRGETNLNHKLNIKVQNISARLIAQQQPFNLGADQICHYAKTFFGFGHWDNPYWVVNLEERGAAVPDEFIRRYEVWEQLGQGELVDLRSFAGRCQIELDWSNRTWIALHRILTQAGISIGKLSIANSLWGGSSVALIETMPFPASNTKEWPYQNWNFEFMNGRNGRTKCQTKFRDARIKYIIEKAKQHKPKLVINCGNIEKEKNSIEETLWLSPKKIKSEISKKRWGGISRIDNTTIREIAARWFNYLKLKNENEY